MRIRALGWLVLVGVLLGGVALAEEGPAGGKAAVPPAADLAEASRQVTQIFGADIAKARQPEERVALVQRLVGVAADSKDPAERYALLDTAHDLAVKAGDLGAAETVIEAMGGHFAIDVLSVRVETYTALSRLTLGPEPGKLLAEWSLQAADAAVERDDYGLAGRFVGLAGTGARVSKDPNLLKQVTDRGREVEQLRGQYEGTRKARETLATTPDDGPALLTCGRFQCFSKGDWEKGLPMLAASGVVPYSSLATLETGRPTDAAGQLQLADLWWAASEKETGLAKQNIQRRAGRWYATALPGLAGLEKARVENRLKSLAGVSPVPASQVSGRLRVPPGFRAQKGTTAEPYTRTGWAKEVVHEATGIEMVFIPAGKFVMGSPESEAGRNDNETPHEVVISRPFYLGKYEVTQGEWQKVMGSNPSGFTGDARLPVERVSWDDCQAFLRKAGGGLRLPTEAEWEYACRAGSQTRFCFGDADSDFGDYGWCASNSDKKTHPVGQKRPNAWGLYDMHGSLWEWCVDWYGKYEFAAGQMTVDPTGPSSGESRVLRGGCWRSPSQDCRSANRRGVTRGGRDITFGVRVALDLK